jgi:hypothetical protein
MIKTAKRVRVECFYNIKMHNLEKSVEHFLEFKIILNSQLLTLFRLLVLQYEEKQKIIVLASLFPSARNNSCRIAKKIFEEFKKTAFDFPTSLN